MDIVLTPSMLATASLCSDGILSVEGFIGGGETAAPREKREVFSSQQLFSLAFHRQSQTYEAIVESALGGFEFCPCNFVSSFGEAGDNSPQIQMGFDSSAGTAQLQTL